MKNLLLALLLFSGCGQKKCCNDEGPPKEDDLVVPSGQLDTTFKRSYLVDGENKKGRVFYIHYINASAKAMDEGYFGEIKKAIIAKGYQVVTFDCPSVFEDSFKDKGAVYKQNYLRFMKWMVQDAIDKHGPAKETIVGGVSFGGLHTLVAVANLPELFNRFFTVVSVIDPNKLNQFHRIDVSLFSAKNSAEKLKGKKALMIYGEIDEIVGPKLNPEMCEALKPDSTCVGIPGSGHDVQQPHVDAVKNWL
jgi:pimeloyl-ACP methyl ester carboxylesterase